jgi:hypothetical protein
MKNLPSELIYHQLYMLLRHILCKYKMFPQKNKSTKTLETPLSRNTNKRQKVQHKLSLQYVGVPY